MDDWQKFSPDLFVKRDELDTLLRWTIANIVPRRLITVAAPPGYGKSWLLEAVGQHLVEQPDFFLIRVSVKNLKSPDQIVAWIRSIIQDAQRIHPEVRSANSGETLETMIAHLTEDLCEHCHPRVRPILIADGFDEPSEAQRLMLETHLFEYFWRNTCVRIIISLRDEFALSSHNLRRGEERLYLGAFPPDQGQEQLNRRIIAEDQILSLQDLFLLAPFYSWTHPYINSYLYETAKKKKSKKKTTTSPLSLTADDLKQSWLLLVTEKSRQKLLPLDRIEIDLQAIAKQDEPCTLETFAKISGYSRSAAYTRIQELIALSLISNERQRYKVVDGIREILRAY